MFQLYPPGGGGAGSDPATSRLLTQQRAWLTDKMFGPQAGCHYHELLARSLYCLPQHPHHVMPFRPVPSPVTAHLRHDLPANTRLQEGLSPYLPLDTRLFTSKEILYDALKTKLTEDGKQSTEGNVEALASAMTSPSGYSSGSNVDTLTSSSSLTSEAKKSFTCPQCKYSTDRKNNLKRHVITMHFDCDRKLECCGTIFRSKAKLREHVTLFHKNGYRCLVCGRMFCRKALLRRHMAVHSGKKDFHCEFCSYATSHKSNLERHQKVHAKSARFIYSHKKPMATFEKKFCSFKIIDEQHRDNTEPQKGEMEIPESRELNSSSGLNYDEEDMPLMDGEDDSVDMSGGEEGPDKFCDAGDIDNCDELDVQNPDHGTTDDDADHDTPPQWPAIGTTPFDIEPAPSECHLLSGPDDLDLDKEAHSETPGASHTTRTRDTQKLATVNYLFQPFDKGIIEYSHPWAKFGIENLIAKQTKLQDDGNNHVDDKENQESNPGDTRALEDSGKSGRKLCPRLCGLPYRCAGCSERFESQERLIHHRCAAPESRDIDTAEKSVSLVARILKQGKNCVL